MDVFAKDISLSSGSACGSGSGETSYVLNEIGINKKNSKSTLRIGISKDNTKDELIYSASKIANIIKNPIDTEFDVVTSRILWLEGLEQGKNLGPGVDSKSRYIYIHGTAEEGLIGKPASDGCVRMSNNDVISLFDKVSINTEVWII